MKPLLQLNLQRDSDKAEPTSLPRPEGGEARPVVVSKRVNQMINRAAHKASSHYGRSGSGIFSK